MKSKWIQYNDKQIFYQDFSNIFFNEKAVIEELNEVQAIVLNQPPRSTLVLSNFSNTEITTKLMPLLNNASNQTKDHVRRTAVIGVTGIKHALGELLSRITGQELMYFDNEIDAKEWLVKD